ncbi:MAG: hypothetical protein Q8N47_05380 [Bryobacterales bacterium]|nr:hypothetical protein [Bryobacterales bacterium]
MQALALNETWTFAEHVRATSRLEAHNLQFKHPSLHRSNASYNRNAPTQAGVVTGPRGVWPEYGNSHATLQPGGRIEF